VRKRLQKIDGESERAQPGEAEPELIMQRTRDRHEVRSPQSPARPRQQRDGRARVVERALAGRRAELGPDGAQLTAQAGRQDPDAG
jgi:hypothetical protein